MSSLKIMKKEFLNRLILYLTISLLLYSFLVDFIFRKYKDYVFFFFLINIQEKIYWITVLIILTCIIFLFIRNKDRIKHKIKHWDKKVLIIFIVLFVISSVRFWNLDATSLNHDETYMVFLPAKCMKDSGFFQKETSCVVYDPEKFGREAYYRLLYYARIPINDKNDEGYAFSIFLSFLSFHILKNPEIIVRAGSAFIGILTIILTFFLVKKLYGYKTGLLASLFLALSPVHIMWSRLGLGEIFIPLFGLLIFYTFKRILEVKNVGFLFLMSAFLGIVGFYTQPIARIFLLIILTLMIIHYKKLVKFGVKNIIISALIFLLFLYPLLFLMYNSDYALNKGVSDKIYKGEMIGEYFDTLKFELEMFFKDIETIDNLKPEGPLLSIYLSILIILAFIYYLFQKKIDSVFFIWLIIPILIIPIFKILKYQYLFSIFPIVFIFISKFLNDFIKISCIRLKKRIICKKFIFYITILIICFIIFNLLCSSVAYFKNIPESVEKKDVYDMELWDYGVKQAVEFLFKEKISDNKFVILEEVKMTSGPYIWYQFMLKGHDYTYENIKKHIQYSPGLNLEEVENWYLNQGFTVYYLVWNPAMHEKYDGLARFKKIHPDSEPVRVINYPSGNPSVNVYEIKAAQETTSQSNLEITNPLNVPRVNSAAQIVLIDDDNIIRKDIPTSCYLGAFAMLVMFNDPSLDFADVVTYSGLGSNADPNSVIGIFDNDPYKRAIITAAQNLGYEYGLGLKPDRETNSVIEDFKNSASEIKYFKDEDEAFNYLKQIINSGKPVEVHLDVYYTIDDFRKNSDIWNTAWEKGHYSHFMTVTGYDNDYIYLNDPTDPDTTIKNIKTPIKNFLFAWGNKGNTPMGQILGHYWMIYLKDKKTKKTVKEIIQWNKDVSQDTAQNLRKTNYSEIRYELSVGRKEFSEFLKRNGYEEAAMLYQEASTIYATNPEDLTMIKRAAQIEEIARGLL